MLERPQTATMYVWQRDQPFDIDYLVFLLGGIRAPTDLELAGHCFYNPMYCTDDFRIFPTTKEQDAQTKKAYGNYAEFFTHFRTPSLEERFAGLGLPIPDIEVTYCPRSHHYADGIDAKKVRAAAAYIAFTGNLVLCVPGTDIENNQYYASEPIAEKLGIAVIPD